MEALILNSNFETVAVLDSFESLIWTERYWECGDFEFYALVNTDILGHLIEGSYIWLKGSETVMITESISINTSFEDGPKLTVTGRSLESILDRRIVWSRTTFEETDFQTAIKKLISDSFINPVDENRKIENFIFVDSEDEYITSLTINAQYLGDNLLDVIQNLCYNKNIGFKITLNEDNMFEFSLYYGVDRSYNQEIRPFVVFSPNYENLLDTEYMCSSENEKTIALVAGEGEGRSQVFVFSESSTGSLSGLERKELFLDASNISSDTDDGALSESVYKSLLVQQGKEELANFIFEEIFDGSADVDNEFEYGKDFFMGDTVQIENEFGMSLICRVVELIRSQDLTGERVYPTFESYKEAE